ncbi:MAG TPA: carboxypeptidase regulatory-like domain-containing protein, partial [Pyrinomonadaceae bacterium]|nr:carboxypeptidase regulatory-like domain-containing protein [Pyrinomonadaceae bacterium]
IDLLPAGVTPNDAGDADSGSNNLQNFPVLSSASASGGNTVVQGTLNSTANATFRIEFFANAACDQSGNGEGGRFLGSTNATTDANGNVTFNPTLAGSTTPGSEFVTATATDASNNTSEFGACVAVNAPAGTFAISGRVLEGAQQGLAGVTVTLTGSQSATTTTDANGNYSFSGLNANGSYTVTPSLTNYTFNPPSQSFNGLNGNQTADFVATRNRHTISGNIHSPDNQPLAGVTVTLSGSQPATTTTNANGNYSFSDLPAGGTYTVTPSLANFTFTPASRAFDNLNANQTADFTGTQGQTFYTIAGRVSDEQNNSLAGVTVTLGGAQSNTTTTDAGGNYSFANLLAGGNYTVTPSRVNYTFTPPSQSFQALNGDKIANFIGTVVNQNALTITGRVTNSNGGAGLGGAQVVVTNPDTGAGVVSTTTNASGDYTLSLPSGGDYTVTPAKAGFTFAPAARTFRNLGANQTANFTATPALSISGRVAGEAGNGIGNVTVTLSGTVTRTVQTLPNGSFLFTNLPANGDYTLRSDSGLFTFNPAQVSRDDLASNTQIGIVATPRAVPLPPQPIEEDFGGNTRDPAKFSEGTLTQPPGSRDPQVTVVQESGKLKINPRAGVDSASFNGYVTTRAVEFTGAQASIEVNQTADNGAQTVFGVGRDERNYFRFVVQDADASASPTRQGIKPQDAALRQLIFQVRTAGVFNGLPIPYDPVQHRYWRFRHDAATNTMFFETSPDRVTWTVQLQVPLGTNVGALAAELNAGTSGSVSNPGQAIFDNLLVQPSTTVNRANNVRFAQATYSANEGAGHVTLTVRRAGNTTGATTVDYATEPFDGRPCNTTDGKARARCDFGTTAGTLRFAPGETEKSFQIFITDDSYTEGAETFRVALGFPSGTVVLEDPSVATVTIADNDAGGSPRDPINTAPF